MNYYYYFVQSNVDMPFTKLLVAMSEICGYFLCFVNHVVIWPPPRESHLGTDRAHCSITFFPLRSACCSYGGYRQSRALQPLVLRAVHSAVSGLPVFHPLSRILQ
jgi:hypothetical protein